MLIQVGFLIRKQVFQRPLRRVEEVFHRSEGHGLLIWRLKDAVVAQLENSRITAGEQDRGVR